MYIEIAYIYITHVHGGFDIELYDIKAIDLSTTHCNIVKIYRRLLQ